MKIEPGCSTAFPFNVQYRIRRIEKYITNGSWLDYGCADGGYSQALLDAGAGAVTGIDVDSDRIEAARRAHPGISFHACTDERLPFQEASFDGVFMNEVFEHVSDEQRTLQEIRRLLKPRGCLAMMSPNRGFPFEGHTVHIGRWTSRSPTLLIPWLPTMLTDKWVTARNYWPRELRQKVSSNGFELVEVGFIMPVFEAHPWLAVAAAQMFRRHITRIDCLPGIRRAGVSNLIVAQRQT